MPNRLAKESSPYLLQHAHNPVDWYPWGPEAFAAARAQNKPIFLSVGYSTCYWCHVMERQSFENQTIAAEMNARFISIKVDREQRPDVDSLYMTAVQLLTRQGGWPMSLFLTPYLRPFYGGTYFPPTDQYGRPGFLTLLRAIDDAFRNRPEEIRQSADQLQQILQRLAEPAPPAEAMTIDQDLLHSLIHRSTADADHHYGGFGTAPKFPRQTLLQLLLAHNARWPNPSHTKILRRTLDAMADGGIHDHLGGGFHRYSTDQQWLVPHFEIMLYDNALLGALYAQAAVQLKTPRYAAVARGIFDFVLRQMTSPDGPFYTAFDAEADAIEGQTYLWTRDQVQSLLGQDATLFCDVYGLDLGPNFSDPHQGTAKPDQNILYLPQPLEAVAARLATTPQALDARLAPMRAKLLAARMARKQPLLDTKVLVSWNALMIRALADASVLLAEPRYLAAARRAADSLLPAMPGSGPAFLDDYAFFAEALLALSAAGSGPSYEAAARRVAGLMCDKFLDDVNGGFYFTEQNAPDLIVRQKIAADTPLPSGNAVAARVLLALGRDADARHTLAAFAGALQQYAEGMSSMLQTAALYLQTHEPITVAGAPDATDRPASPQQLAARVVEIESDWLTPSELHLHLSILRGFHINTNHPAADLLPTHLLVPDDIAAEVDYPPGRDRTFPFSQEPLSVYEGKVTLVVRFAAPIAGQPPLPLALSYQACDDQSCLPGVTKSFHVNAP